MTNWNEADHPRDTEGKFTYKGSSSSYSSSKKESNEEKMQNRANILYPSMEDKNKTKKNLLLGESIYDEDSNNLEMIKNTLSKKDEPSLYKSRYERTHEEENELLDKFYPSMKNQDKNNNINKLPETSEKKVGNSLIQKINNQGLPMKIQNYINNIKEKNNKDKTLLLQASIEKSDLKLSDQNFMDSMDVVFMHEGGFSNDPSDLGGRTNMGITQKTYDDYCKRHNLEKKDVKNLTKEEAIEVYYNDYWEASGADKIDNPVGALIVFDTAVLHGPGRAKQFYKQANGDFNKMIQLRKDYYIKRVKDNPTQQKFLKGWNNRADNLNKKLKEYEESDN